MMTVSIAFVSILTCKTTQDGIRDFTPTELAEAKSKGWVLSDKTDQQGIRRRVFVKKKGDEEIRHGYFASWFKNGKPRSMLTFKNGEVLGHATTFYENGNVGSRGILKGNIRDGAWNIWNQDGTKARAGSYKLGIEDGVWKFWYANGNLAAKGAYKEGLQTGTWEFFKPQGDVRRVVKFAEGLPFPLVRDRKVIIPPKQPPAPQLVVKVDARMELLAVIQSLTDWPSFGAWDSYNDAYQQDVSRWFEKYRTHPAVVKYNEMLNAGTNFAFDGPIIWILHYSSGIELEKLTPLPKEVAERGGSEAQLDELASLMRQFAKDTKFQEFFDAHKPFYDSLVKGYLDVSQGQKGVQLVSDYYGETRSAATSIICPLFGGGNYGPQIVINGERQIFNVAAPQGFKDGKFTFDPEKVRGLIYHEFGHSFSNPAVDSIPELKKYEDQYFPPISNRMSAIAYGSWGATCYELFNRTHEIRLMELSGDTKLARKALAVYIGLGFVWLPYTLEKLEAFERNRTKYPTQLSYFPNITKVFDETEMFVVDGYAICALPKLRKAPSQI
jgi:hypothetical protein